METGKFNFRADLNSGRIEGADLRITASSGDYFFEGYEGTGSITNETFSVTNWGRRLAGKVAALGGDFSGSKVLSSVQWSATDNSNYTISGTGNTFSHADNGAPLLPNPNGVSGGFKGDLVRVSGTAMDHGDFQFNVDLNTGFVSGASMQGVDASDIRLFGAYQGTGRLVPVSSTSDILVDTWTTSTGGHFVLRSPVFDTSTRAVHLTLTLIWPPAASPTPR